MISGNLVWILQQNGTIPRINPDTFSIIDSLKYSKKIVAFGRSKTDTVYAADEEGGVFQIFDNKDTNYIWNTNEPVRSFVFTSDNNCFLITDKGIYDLYLTFRSYFENSFSNQVLWHFNKWKWHPSTHFVDTNDNIWLGFSGGEWGGDIVIFSTKDYRFIKFKERQEDYCYIRPVISFFQIDTVMYAVTSLQHMSMLSSSIIEITDTCHYYFESPLHYSNTDDSARNLFYGHELYMGPAVYNKTDSSIYFYCQYGIFKGNIEKDLSLLDNWQHLFKANLSWYYGMPDAVGYGMNVSKMFFEKGKLFIVSPDNGVVIWDGQRAVLLKTNYEPGLLKS